jgi:hypothetical protein
MFFFYKSKFKDAFAARAITFRTFFLTNLRNMKIENFHKSGFYLLLTLIGILLILIGVFLLLNAFSEHDNSQITIKAILLFLWIVFTISNFFLYKKERKNEKMQ